MMHLCTLCLVSNTTVVKEVEFGMFTLHVVNSIQQINNIVILRGGKVKTVWEFLFLICTLCQEKAED